MSGSGPFANDPGAVRKVLAPPLRVGIVGAGRTQQGLGPYFADAFEAAGAVVTAVSGRDEASAQRAAAALTTRLGHAVAAAADAHSLARSVDAIVVASPVAHHLEGLDAALAAGVTCLCEKPLVPWQDAAAGRERIAQFRARGLLLDENCQWPFVLSALFALHPEIVGAPVRRIAMGLGPAAAGPTMVADSLSHVLSVAQALVAIDAQTTLANVRQTNQAPDAEANVVAFELTATSGPIAVELHLRRCPEPPRPAWIAVNGLRIDRRIGPDYTQSFVAHDRTVNVQDPLRQLVYRFAALQQANDRERTRTFATAFATAVDVRLRLYAGVLRALDACTR